MTGTPALSESLDRLEAAVKRLETAALAQQARVMRAERRYKVLEHHSEAAVSALDALIAGARIGG